MSWSLGGEPSWSWQLPQIHLAIRGRHPCPSCKHDGCISDPRVHQHNFDALYGASQPVCSSSVSLCVQRPSHSRRQKNWRKTHERRSQLQQFESCIALQASLDARRICFSGNLGAPELAWSGAWRSYVAPSDTRIVRIVWRCEVISGRCFVRLRSRLLAQISSVLPEKCQLLTLSLRDLVTVSLQ